MKNARAPLLYIDQFGNSFWAQTVKELRQQIGNGKSRISKIYCDKTDGRTMHVGYVIGQHWLNAHALVEKPAFSRVNATVGAA
jgi:hypothetical protein